MNKIIAVAFTDGRSEEVFTFDARFDTEETVALLTDRMAENGWLPVKGSGRILARDEQGILKPVINGRRFLTNHHMKIA